MTQSPTGPQNLIHMANDIAHFFATNGDRRAAVLAISNHLKSFWTPSMRRKLIREMQTGRSDEPLEDLPREALRFLREDPRHETSQLPEGSARGAVTSAAANELI